MNNPMGLNEKGTNMSATPKELSEFSLVLGGPLYRLWHRIGLLRPPLGLVPRRIVSMALIAWLPLLVLSLLDGNGLLFLKGLGAHVRLLIVLPLLIAAEGPIHRRLENTVRQLVRRGIVSKEELPKLNSIIRSSNRARDSFLLECSLLVIVYTLGQWVWREYWALGRTSWYAVVNASGWHLTLAGYWYAFVSVPVSQFILLRWGLRLGLWFWFLWRVARLDLHIIPTHPDRAGGLGFLGNSAYAFGLLLFAGGTQLAGQIAQRIFFEGRSLLAYKVDVFLALIFLVSLILAPLMVFTPLLIRTKLRGRSEYGTLANRYVSEFDAKWIRDADNTDDRFIGSPDIQSLADMANSYAVVQSMRPVPFSLDIVTFLVAVTVAPLLPLVLTIIPLEKLVDSVIKTIL